MGNDGGSIPKRRELVKEAARNPTAAQLKETQHEQQDHLWNTDPLTQQPLSRPVVSDSFGRLFNKDSVIEFLLPAEDGDGSVRAEQELLLRGAIRSLKDVVEVKFEIDGNDAACERSATGRTERWICPVTRLEMGPSARAVYLVPCGHAFAGAAVKAISGERCPQCDQSYAENDAIAILATSEVEIARLELRMRTLKEKGLTHSLKKVNGAGKKKRKHATDAVETGSSVVAESVVAEPAEAEAEREKSKIHADKSKESTPQPPTLNGKAANGIKNASTASLTAKVLEEQEARNKRRKVERNENLNSLFTKSKDPTSSKASDISFMNRGFAIPGRR